MVAVVSKVSQPGVAGIASRSAAAPGDVKVVLRIAGLLLLGTGAVIVVFNVQEYRLSLTLAGSIAHLHLQMSSAVFLERARTLCAAGLATGLLTVTSAAGLIGLRRWGVWVACVAATILLIFPIFSRVFLPSDLHFQGPALPDWLNISMIGLVLSITWMARSAFRTVD